MEIPKASAGQEDSGGDGDCPTESESEVEFYHSVSCFDEDKEEIIDPKLIIECDIVFVWDHGLDLTDRDR